VITTIKINIIKIYYIYVEMGVGSWELGECVATYGKNVAQ